MRPSLRPWLLGAGVLALGGGASLYGMVGSTFIELSPDSGQLREIGPSEGDLRMSWDRADAVLRGIRNPKASPSIATIDRCTGEILGGPGIFVLGRQAAVAEGLTQAPEGTVYLVVDTTPPPAGTTCSGSTSSHASSCGSISRPGSRSRSGASRTPRATSGPAA